LEAETPGGSGRGERGISSIQFLVASALGLVLFLLLANLVVVQYGRGAIRSALEQGARAGALSGSASECAARADEVIGQLLGGRMSDGLEVACATTGTVMVASASGFFEPWTPMTPEFAIELESQALVEELP
jgi:hypothetical protein